MKQPHVNSLSRRQLVLGASSAFALCSLPFPPISLATTAPDTRRPATLSGNQFDLCIEYQTVNYTGKNRLATTVNGSLPGPTLRWKEGERVTLRVTNRLAVESSIHWHGIVLPSSMDGSPGFDFTGIKPGETFEYQFDVQQSGTYWYHSHSGFQEQTGLLGAIVIEPKDPDPVTHDDEMVILLSDWTDKAPEQVYATLKKMSHYYNYRERTAGDLWRDIKSKGLMRTWNERAMWNQMRMSQTDIADVSGCAYTYLMNGTSPAEGWFGVCKPGEKVRLRIINGAAMSIFDVRIPGLTMTVVAADGQNIQPVTVDEFRIGAAETYDVIVTLDADRAYTLFAQTIDRTGFARGTLTTNIALRAEIPELDPAPVLNHQDMGMGMSNMDHSAHNMETMMAMDHSSHTMGNMEGMDHSSMDTMAGMDHSTHDMPILPSEPVIMSNLIKAGFGNSVDSGNSIMHATTEFGPHVDMHTMAPVSGLTDPGIGLRDHLENYHRKVLTYADLRSLHPTRDKREPTREIELHLTGNMERYTWSVNGVSFMDSAPLELTYGERVRIILVNDTMMTHPIHLHGMWSELETGDPDYIPRKHTVLVQPGSKISYLLTADAKGHWAYHCHLLYHMLGMMRTVKVV